MGSAGQAPRERANPATSDRAKAPTLRAFSARLVEPTRRRKSRPAAIRRLARALDRGDSQVVVVDYFGTLVTRSVPPWYVKQLSAQRLSELLALDMDPADLYRARLEIERGLCRRARDHGFDPEFRLDDLAVEYASLVARSGSGPRISGYSSDDLAKLIIDAEVESELSVQQVDEDLVRTLREGSGGRRLVLASDYHVPRPEFGRFLQHHELMDLFEDVFVSCEHLRTKKSGALFDLITDQLCVAPEDVLVVGDNPISDGQSARVRGMRTQHMPPGKWEQLKRATPEEVARDVASSLERLLRPTDEFDLFPAMALSLYAFIRDLHRRLAPAGVDEAFFLAREGQFLSRLLAAFEEEQAVPESMRIRRRYLMVSRRSTYLPSLPSLREASFDELRTQPDLTTADFLNMLGLDADVVERIAMGVGGDPSGTGRLDLDAVLAHPAFPDEYERRRAEQTKALLTYLDAEADLSRRSTMNLVDVGWKGTVQDQLARVVMRRHDIALSGYYIGLVTQRSTSDPRDPSKVGILFHNRPHPSVHFEVFSHHKTLFEALLSADHGSVTGYEQVHGRAGPVLEDVPEERVAHQEQIAPVQCHIERRFRLICREVARTSMTGGELMSVVARHHARMVYRPSIAEIRFFERLPVYDLGRRRTHRPQHEASRARVALGSLLAPRRLVTGGGWPPLRMQAAGVGFLRHPYGWYKLGVERRRGRMERPSSAAARTSP